MSRNHKILIIIRKLIYVSRTWRRK